MTSSGTGHAGEARPGTSPPRRCRRAAGSPRAARLRPVRAGRPESASRPRRDRSPTSEFRGAFLSSQADAQGRLAELRGRVAGASQRAGTHARNRADLDHQPVLPLRIDGSTWWTTLNEPVRLVAIIRSQSAGSSDSRLGSSRWCRRCKPGHRSIQTRRRSGRRAT